MTTTEIVKVDSKNPEKKVIERAARILIRGGLVAFPTETVYGLGANALDEDAVLKIFEVKNRPSDNPLIIHIAKIDDLYLISSKVPKKAEKLVQKFWPGPLTLVLPRSEIVPDPPVAGLSTVAIRMPSHPVAHALISMSDLPIAAPSANLAGRPSPTTAEHVVKDLDGKIELILDGGEITFGVESTVIDFTSPVPTILRPGPITVEELREELGEVEVHSVAGQEGAEEVIVKSPGMKYRHYAPKAEVTVVEGDPILARKKIKEIVNEKKKTGKRVGVVTTAENAHAYQADVLKVVGERNNSRQIAKNLFKVLRELDAEEVDFAVVEGIEPVGIGLAVMNRLRKAAGHNIVRV